jgi:hypothetical protein
MTYISIKDYYLVLLKFIWPISSYNNDWDLKMAYKRQETPP